MNFGLNATTSRQLVEKAATLKVGIIASGKGLDDPCGDGGWGWPAQRK